MDANQFGDRLPGWFHRANWGGGALACVAIGLFPWVAWGYTVYWALWAVVWMVLGAGAAKNAWLGVNSISIPARFRSKLRG